MAYSAVALRVDTEVKMTQVEQIQQEILQLPNEEFMDLRRWIVEIEWERWDKEIERDDADGKLDFLFKEARMAKTKEELREL